MPSPLRLLLALTLIALLYGPMAARAQIDAEQAESPRPAGTMPPAVERAPLEIENPDRLGELLRRHRGAMLETVALFDHSSMRVNFDDGESGGVSRVVQYWQDGRFREEFHWLGFSEAFAFDGHNHWYGSSLNLPYLLDSHYDPDVTLQYSTCFHYLSLGQREFLSLPESVPLYFGKQYEVIRYSPPQMSEALLLIDPETFGLAGVLYGNARRLEDSVLYRLTELRDWRDFGACRYPSSISTISLSLEGEVLRERSIITTAVEQIEPIDPAFFEIGMAPEVPLPALPSTPFELPFSLSDGNIVLNAESSDGQRLKLELDTGAAVGLMRRSEAERIGLAPVGRERVTGHGGSAYAQYARVEGINLIGREGERLTLPPWPAAVLVESGGLEQSLENHGVSGLLGNFVLNYYVVKVDFRRRLMTLYQPDQFRPEQHLQPGYHAIPVTRDSMPYAEVQVDGAIHGGAFFNTGAQQFFTLALWAIEDAGLSYEVEAIGSGVTVAGSKAFFTIRPDLVELGEIRIEKPSTHMELLAPGEAPNRNRIASFGSAFFERYAVTFDLFHEVYYIEGGEELQTH